MTRTKMLAVAFVTVVALISGTIVIGQPAKESKGPASADFKLPPGWTEEDVQAMMAAATPGKMHEHLAKDVGVWQGKSTMWMAPDAPPMKSESTATVKPMLDGRFTECEVEGEMPGMGPFR